MFACCQRNTEEDVNEDEEKPKQELGPPPRQWIYDRAHGVARAAPQDITGVSAMPPCFLCYPPPVVKACPSILEENSICTFVGKCGFCSADDSWTRWMVFRYALTLSVIGFLLTLFASFSLSTNFDILQYASFRQAELTPRPDNFFSHPIHMHVGLRAVALENLNTYGQQVIRFDEFCDLLRTGMNRYMEEEDCGHCEDVQWQLVMGLVVAIVGHVPSILSDILRMYGAADMNCAKTWSLFISLITLVGFFLTHYQFMNNCVEATFFEDEVSYGRSGVVVEKDAEVVAVTYDWTAGYGLFCLYAAFALKIVDVICHCCVPTPVITRNRREQRLYQEIFLDEQPDDEPSDSEDN